MRQTSAEHQFVTALLDRVRRSGVDWRILSGAAVCEVEEFRLVVSVAGEGDLYRLAVLDRDHRDLIVVEGGTLDRAAHAILQTTLDDLRLARLVARLRQTPRPNLPWWAGLTAARGQPGGESGAPL